MTNDLASIVDEQEKEIDRLRAELALVRRDWQADAGTLLAKLQTAEAQRDAARAEVAELRDVLQDLYDDWQGPSTSSLVAARAALRLGGAR